MSVSEQNERTKASRKPWSVPYYSLTTINALEREIDRARRHGIAFDNEEIEPGLRCIAAGVRDDSGELVAGLSVSAPVERHSPDWAAMVKDTADAISLAIGYSGKTAVK